MFCMLATGIEHQRLRIVGRHAHPDASVNAGYSQPDKHTTTIDGRCLRFPYFNVTFGLYSTRVACVGVIQVPPTQPPAERVKRGVLTPPTTTAE